MQVDTLILLDESIAGLRNLKMMFDCFELVSSSLIYLDKSGIMGLGCTYSKCFQMATLLGCKAQIFPLNIWI